MIGGVVLGTEEFARQASQALKMNPQEQPVLDRFPGRAEWDQIVRAIESAKGEKWESFCNRYRDWGRDAALWLGRRVGRLTLAQLAQRIGAVNYMTAGAAVSRFDRRLAKDSKLAATLHELLRQLSNV